MTALARFAPSFSPWTLRGPGSKSHGWQSKSSPFEYPDEFVFMDAETYDQLSVPAATVAEAASYLLDNAEVVVAVHDGIALYVELPVSELLLA